jgi:hypothetical protein
VNPYDFHPELISDNGGLPHGIAGGVSWAHPLGVEPLTGRDILARLLYGSSVSLLIAVTATVLTVSFGTIIVIVSGYVRGWLGPSRGARRGGNHRGGLQPPGLGKLAVSSVVEYDLPVITGVTLIAAAFIIIANMIVDVLYAAVDPRVRLTAI